MNGLLAIHNALAVQRRLSLAATAHARASGLELAALVTAGVSAALATTFVKMPLHVPGHAIVLAVFPMALGLSLAPRRLGGSIMSVTALLTAAALRWGGAGGTGAGALTSLSLTGPLLDLALLGAQNGWRVYLAIILAGLGSNLAAFGVRAVTKLLGWEPGLRQFIEWWPQATVSYALCGAIAGLVSALAWFHLAARPRCGGAEEGRV